MCWKQSANMITWTLTDPPEPTLALKITKDRSKYDLRLSQQAENLLKSNEEIKIATRRTAKCPQNDYGKIQRS